MIGKTISHYRIIEKSGSGGMGDVYKAEDTKLKRIVALKFLPPELTRDKEARERFMHEACAASALDHPNIGTIYEINDDHKGRFFIAMAYYEGQTLKDKIAEGPLDIGEAVGIIRQILNGLAAAHAKDIVHRDVKPANIMLTNDGQVKIIDFGLAKLKGRSVLTKTGTTMGTVAYMSPEQVKGKKVDHRTDIWSVGVILYEMFTGDKPFKGDYEQAIMYRILNEEPEFVPKLRRDTPMRLGKIIETALTKKPDKRYATVDHMAADLAAAAEEQKSGATSFQLGRKQRKLLYRIGTTFIIVLLLSLYFWKTTAQSKAPVSLILLPLKSIDQDAEQEWFADVMTDALITDLAKINGIRVIALSSAMQYKGKNLPPPEIAKELDVQYVIEGSVVKANDQIRISTRLINAPENEYLWAEDYERGFQDILYSCFFGKIIKMAQGNPYTHAGESTIDFDLLAYWCGSRGMKEEKTLMIREANTGREAREIIRRDAHGEIIFKDIVNRAISSARTFAGPFPNITYYLFDFNGDLLAIQRNEGTYETPL